MRMFIDANFLIYLNTLTDPEARRNFEEAYVELVRDHILYTDALVLDEVLWVSRRKYGVPFDVTSDFIRSLLLPFVELIPLGEDEVLGSLSLLDRGLKPSDALHLAAMRGRGIDHIVSEDAELDRVPWVGRVWPVEVS